MAIKSDFLNIVLRYNGLFFKEVIKDFLFVVSKITAASVTVFSKFYFDDIFDATRSGGHNDDSVCQEYGFLDIMCNHDHGIMELLADL